MCKSFPVYLSYIGIRSFMIPS